MLLFKLNNQADEMLLTLDKALREEGVDSFFNHPDTLKKHLHITDEDIQRLAEESAFYYSHKDTESAIAALTWLTILEPINSYHFLRFGALLLEEEQYEPALDILQEGITLDPQNPEFYLYMGICFSKLNKKEEAQEFFQEAVVLSQDQPEYKQIHDLSKQAILLRSYI